MARLKDKVCIVTGATSGIRRRTAEVFAQVVPQGPAARGPAAAPDGPIDGA
jgi:NAD(P)-dependent dehydrogenase (short-subunit alcohol dehydrogenase family)